MKNGVYSTARLIHCEISKDMSVCFDIACLFDARALRDVLYTQPPPRNTRTPIEVFTPRHILQIYPRLDRQQAQNTTLLT
jgi:hypothetical protein